MKNLNLQNIKIFIVCLFLLIFGGSIYYNINLSNQLKQTEICYVASMDSVKQATNKIGELTYSKNILIQDIDELKQTNTKLAKEIDKLTYSEKRNLLEIDRLNLIIKNSKDSITQSLDTSFIKENTYKFNYSINDKYRTLEGYTLVYSHSPPDSSQFYIEKDIINANITLSKKETKNGIEMSVSSDNPYVQINSIEGAIVDIEAYQKYQKPKKWGLGVGIGVMTGYDMINKSLFFGPGITVSLNYNILTW